MREWLGASEGDYFESKGAKRKKLTPEERKEEAAKNGRQSQAAARRGEWTPNPFGGDPKGAGQLTLHTCSTPLPPHALSYLPTPLPTPLPMPLPTPLPRPTPHPPLATPSPPHKPHERHPSVRLALLVFENTSAALISQLPPPPCPR